MLKQVLLLTSLLTLVYLSGYAQDAKRFYIGAQAGMTRSNIIQDESVVGDISFKSGLTMGVNVEYRFTQQIFIESSFNYLQNGHKLIDELVLINPDGTPVKNSYIGYKDINKKSYLQNQLDIGYAFGNRLRIAPSVGFYIGHCIENKINSTSYTYLSQEDWDLLNDLSIPFGYYEVKQEETMSEDLYYKTDYGLAAGTTISYPLSDKLEYVAKINYQRGMNNIRKNPSEYFGKYYNNTFSITLGIKFQL